jgi:ribose transport system ATP-binding protein
LDNVSISFAKGEIHAIVGQNGAGKSTIVKILAGIYKPDGGEILFKGRPTEVHGPQDARKLGLAVIHQEFQLIPYLNVAENIYLGREPLRFGEPLAFIEWKELYENSASLLNQLDSAIDAKALVSELGISDQQIVEIAKALSMSADVILMDEPTASLTAPEIHRLFSIMSNLRSRGVTIIYISHRMEEVFDIADSITVMTDGRCVRSAGIHEVSIEDVIRLMIGRNIEDMYPQKESRAGDEALRVEGLSIPGVLTDINFTVRSGEILGIFGFIGSGRTELAKALFGAAPARSGRIFVLGREKPIRSVRDAIDAGIALVTEDRKREGLFLDMSVMDNICIANLSPISRLGFINKRKARDVADAFVRQLSIKTPSLGHIMKNLSGGNQQKTVVAKWLNSESPIVVFDEPTRGIDIGAKVEMYQIINSLAKRGSAIIVISSELSEVLGISDRLLVMKEGRIIARAVSSEATKEEVLKYALGTANTA